MVFARAPLAALMILAVVSLAKADSYEPEDANNASWEFARGDRRCPKNIDIGTEDDEFDAGDLEVRDSGDDGDNEECTGAGTVELTENPSSGGGRLSAALREQEDDRDQSYEGTQSGEMVCGDLPIPDGTHWIFFSPEDEFTINPSEILGGTSAVLAAGQSGAVEFQEDANYMFIGESCLYKQKSRLAEATDGDSVCFPAAATATLESGARVPMSDLQIGDSVLVGPSTYSPIFMFTHKLADTRHMFTTLTTASGAAVTLTKGHYIYANGVPTAAGAVRVGDLLTLASGATSAVTATSTAPGVGLYNPQTVAGDIVVDGVLASSYTAAVEPSLAHAALAPFRWAAALGWTTSAFETGAPAAAAVAPRGAGAF